jgi:hypothetical protein
MTDEDGPVRKRMVPKSGFGMAPISDTMRARYDDAVGSALRYLEGQTESYDVDLGHLSELKGMFNRCVRQDQ